MLTMMTRILLILAGFAAGAAISVGANGVMRARDWPARERLGAWFVATLFWLAAILVLVTALTAPL